MAKDLMNAVTSKTLLEMKNIVDNWVNDENFTRTSQTKTLAMSFQQILAGLVTNNGEIAVEGVKLLDTVLREGFQIKK